MRFAIKVKRNSAHSRYLWVRMNNSNFDYKGFDLPITEVVPAVQQALANNSTLIVNAPPGAGKSTLLPLTLFRAPWLDGKKVLMLEPRRLAARSIAHRMADLLDEEVGDSIGFRIRFEAKSGPNTKLEVLTEGILTRMLQHDNALEDVGMVIFDEFHERSLHADLALALCREAQQVLRPDLRIVIMSATLDMPTLTELLQCPVVKSEGRQYPVNINYVGEADRFMLPELAARTIIQATKKHDGDVLAFLPGQGEIKRCEELLNNQLSGFSICPLYGALPFGKQQRAVRPDRDGKRKVVLATSIAETSLTIEGVRVVVDTGYGRRSKFNAKSGLSGLQTVQIDQDTAEQRSGRAGRLSEGHCYRLWTAGTHAQLTQHRAPEILELDLSSLVLNLAEWGIQDVASLTWLTPPPAGMLQGARDTLEEIGALEDGKITAHGKRLNQLPCHPRIAHMLVAAEDMDLLGLATDLAAVIEERDPLPAESGIDINLRIEALRRHRKGEKKTRKLERIDQVARLYRKLFNAEPSNATFDPYETGVLLVHAYPERIASARPGNNAQFQLANGRLAMASHKDDLAFESWLAVAHVDARDGMGKIFMAAPLNPQDLAPMVKEQKVVTWDTKKGGLKASLDLRIGSIVLQSKPLNEPDEAELKQAICNALKKEGEWLLPFNDQVKNWQNRVISLRKWHPQAGWPDVSTPALLASVDEWLPPYLNNIKKPEDLKKIELEQVLHYHLQSTQQAELDRLAPTKIEVPSGSKIKLEYQANGSAPVLKVRLQELFGLTTTPSVNGGNTNVLLHLLSPGFKPVQITADLVSFWDNTYFEVRKDLKGRYPKHYWPDNPLEHEAVRGAKKRKK